jgi:hypothetical protein
MEVKIVFVFEGKNDSEWQSILWPIPEFTPEVCEQMTAHQEIATVISSHPKLMASFMSRCAWEHATQDATARSQMMGIPSYSDLLLAVKGKISNSAQKEIDAALAASPNALEEKLSGLFRTLKVRQKRVELAVSGFPGIDDHSEVVKP